jgi:F420-dependent oxidoreductase-like protein
MRFAFKTNPQDTTWQAMLDVWTAADDIELFESGWTFDHFYPIFGDSTGPCLEGWTTLAALAQATRRVRLGVMVTGMVHRHPAVLANMAATVDIVSDGRLELGLGAAWNTEELDAYGIPLGTLKERSDRFEEGVEVIVRLLTDTEPTFSGEYFTLTAARCEPKPVQQPHPPIVIGGGGERRTLRTAARFAQHWNIGTSVDDWLHKRDVLREHCAAVGRDPSEIMTSVMLRLGPDGEPGPVAEQAAQFRDAGADMAVVNLPSPHRVDHLEKLASALESVGAGA